MTTLLVAAALFLGGPRVVVISVGNDPALAGALQRTMELRVGSVPGISMKSASELGPQLGMRLGPLVADPGAMRRVKDLIDAASKSYYDDKYLDAFDKLSKASDLLDHTPHYPISERVRLQLWRAAVALALNDPDKAAAEARAALVLAPALAVDLTVFRPSVGKLVEEVRARALPQAGVAVEALPPGGEVFIDDRPVQGERFRAPAGRHRIVARAPGFREVERWVDLNGEQALPVPLPLALDPVLERSLVTVTGRGEVSPSDAAVLGKLTDRIEAEVVVIALSRYEPTAEARAAVFANGLVTASPAFGAGTEALGALAEWAAGKVELVRGGTLGSTPTPTPEQVVREEVRPTPVPTPSRVVIPSRTVRGVSPALSAEAGFAVAQSSRQVSGGGGGFSSGFVGVGPWGRVSYGQSGLTGSLELSLISYAVSRLDVNNPQPLAGRTTIDGGGTVTARLGVGYRYAFGEDEDGAALRALVGLFYEQHSSGGDIPSPTGGQSEGLFPSQTIAGLEARLDGDLPLARPGDGLIALRGLVGAIPVSQWTESPTGSTGTSPAASLAPEWGLGLLWAPGEGWRFSLDYRGELRTATFSGYMTTSNTLSPPVRGAQVTEGLNTGFLAIQRRF